VQISDVADNDHVVNCNDGRCELQDVNSSGIIFNPGSVDNQELWSCDEVSLCVADGPVCTNSSGAWGDYERTDGTRETATDGDGASRLAVAAAANLAVSKAGASGLEDMLPSLVVRCSLETPVLLIPPICATERVGDDVLDQATKSAAVLQAWQAGPSRSERSPSRIDMRLLSRDSYCASMKNAVIVESTEDDELNSIDGDELIANQNSPSDDTRETVAGKTELVEPQVETARDDKNTVQLLAVKRSCDACTATEIVLRSGDTKFVCSLLCVQKCVVPTAADVAVSSSAIEVMAEEKPKSTTTTFMAVSAAELKLWYTTTSELRLLSTATILALEREVIIRRGSRAQRPVDPGGETVTSLNQPQVIHIATCLILIVHGILIFYAVLRGPKHDGIFVVFLGRLKRLIAEPRSSLLAATSVLEEADLAPSPTMIIARDIWIDKLGIDKLGSAAMREPGSVDDRPNGSSTGANGFAAL